MAVLHFHLVLAVLSLSFAALVSCALIPQQGNHREPSPQCDPGEENNCAKCFDTLVNELIINDRNRFNLQETFFAPGTSGPVFVTVQYIFTRNLTGDGTTNYTAAGTNKTWYWTRSTIYLFQPIETIQFTSLLFTDPSLRTSSVKLYLQPGCTNSSDDMMMLLTQRLKIYTMEQSIAARIDDSYSAKGQNLETLRKYHLGKSIPGGQHVTKYTLSFQIIFPIVAVVILTLLFYHVLDRRDFHSIRNRRPVEQDLGLKDGYFSEAKMSTKNSRIVTMVLFSFTFVIYVIVLDCIAVSYRHLRVQENIFYRPTETPTMIKNDVLYLFQMEYAVPLIMMCYDFLVLLALVALNIYIRCRENKVIPKWHYVLLGPCFCIAIHCYHIILGFIETPRHASSIVVFYVICCVSFITTIQVVYSFLYGCLYNKFKIEQDQGRSCRIKSLLEWNCCSSAFFKSYPWPHSLFFLILSVTSVFVAGFLVFIVILFVLIPINMAIEDAPESLLSINQTVIIFFGAAVTYKIIVEGKKKTFLDLLVGAKNRLPQSRSNIPDSSIHNFAAEQDCSAQELQGWKKKSLKEKNEAMANFLFQLLVHISNYKRTDTTVTE